MKTKRTFTLLELVIVIVIIGITVFIMIDMFENRDRRTPSKLRCISNLKQIGLAIRMYAQEYKEEFPNCEGAKGLEMLRSGGYLENVKLYNCPSTTDMITDNYDLRASSISYSYASGLNESTSVDSAVAWDKPCNHNKFGNILFVDGHAAGFAGVKWMENVK